MTQPEIVIEGDDKTGYSAYSPEVPGCVATGSTIEECTELMRSALRAHLDILDEAQ